MFLLDGRSEADVDTDLAVAPATGSLASTECSMHEYTCPCSLILEESTILSRVMSSRSCEGISVHLQQAQERVARLRWWQRQRHDEVTGNGVGPAEGDHAPLEKDELSPSCLPARILEHIAGSSRIFTT